jgi:hypothetical protein
MQNVLFQKSKKGKTMNRNRTLYCQKRAAGALTAEYGFAPATLKKIVLLEADDMCFYIHFRIEQHYYTYRHGKIERTDDKGAAI